LFVDESHVTVPQIGAMYKGDASRKRTLLEHGFRLPSCADNRPLMFEEWNAFRPQTIFVSATPSKWELEQTGGVFAEQLIRPTGLIDPPIEVRPVTSQVDDLIGEIRLITAQGGRILVTALTKKMAEQLTDYFLDQDLKVKYMHADTETLERIQIVHDLRAGVFDVLIGINLLREGLDIPECQLVAVLDADKEGFLRSETALIQIIGRAARNAKGRVILYADRITGSMTRAMSETKRRRDYQRAYNQEHGITPTSTLRTLTENNALEVKKNTRSKKGLKGEDGIEAFGKKITRAQIPAYIKSLETKMAAAVEVLDFEMATEYRDEIAFYRTLILELGGA
jgi:excinuclease ABC subunit B